jgi:hypothetical protein
MAALNRLLAGVTDIVLAPLAVLPPLAGLALVSFATAVAVLLAVRKTSNQAQLAAVKRALHAGFFELRLFGDDVPAILRTELEMLRHSLTYLRLSFIPVLWLIVPLTILIIHLDFYFGYTGLVPGTRALLTTTLDHGGHADAASDRGSNGGPPVGSVTLEVPLSMRVDTPAVWFPGARQMVWRITPNVTGDYVVRVRLGAETFEKTLKVSDGVGRRSPVRVRGSAVDQLLNPSEAPLPADSQVTSIAVTYPRREIHVLGWDVNWIVVYFVLSFLFMLALRGPLGVVV